MINLSADLGGGKTTFVKGLARGIGSADRVSSPTFTLSKVYKSKTLEVHHYDFYRLGEAGVLADQIQESIADSRAITVIEWSEIVKDVLPQDSINIKFEPTATDPDERKVTLSYPESRVGLVKRFETNLAEIET